jgi:sulfite exporter TauE/SafE
VDTGQRGCAVVVVISLGIGLILAGLVMAWLSNTVKHATLATVVYYVGIALVVVGLILLLAPVVSYVDTQLRSMLRL